MKAFWADVCRVKSENTDLRKKVESDGKKYGFELAVLREKLMESNNLLTKKKQLICSSLKQGRDLAELHRHYARLLEDQQVAHDLEMNRLNAEFPVGPFPTVESEEKAVKNAVRATLRKMMSQSTLTMRKLS